MAAMDLLAGPRGRRLCWSVLWLAMIDAPGAPAWERVWAAAYAGDLSAHAEDLAGLAPTAAAWLDGAAGDLALLPALGDAVEAAMYWQPPDEFDQALGSETARQALGPVARALADSPATRWWADPVALDSQICVQWPGMADRSRPPTDVRGELAAWLSAEVEEEAGAVERPADPAANYSGHWWSTPAHSMLVATTRALPGIGAVGLALVEDRLDWREARCLPVTPPRDARVCEIAGPDDWARLVGRYPFDVTRSRRHDWWRAAGWAGTWVIPDYAAVAVDYDGIHLTVLGYLTTAGRALPVDDARTMLAGWDPDKTYWLTDSVAFSGEATRWALADDDPARWLQAPDS